MSETFDFSLLERNLEVLKSVYKMEYFTMEALCALIYTQQGREADKARLEACKGLLKSKFGMFSDFRGYLQLPLVTKMSLAEDAEAYVQGVSDTYHRLNASYKLGSTPRLLAAMVIYENADPEDHAEVCERTQAVFARFRENHPWLTSQEDMPFAALIALRGDDVDAQIAETERCYEALKSLFRFAPNELQTVSHILALSREDASEKAERYTRLHDGFKARKSRFTGYHLPVLALLVISGLSPEQALEETLRNDETLKPMKGFHGLLGMTQMDRRMFAASITALDHLEGAASTVAVTDSAVMSTVISTILSIETMILIISISAAVNASINT